MGLPELNVDKGEIVDRAKQAVELNGRIAELETKVKAAKAELATIAVKLRDEQLTKDKYIGMVRVTGEDLPAIRIEMRTNSFSALDIDQAEVLDAVFGASRPLIWARGSFVTEILDPDKLIADLVAAGKNPWDHLTLSVRGGQDDVVASCTEAVTVQEAFQPTKDWLDTLNNIVHTLSNVAKKFLIEYITKATQPTVVLGSRGKAKSKKED